MKVWKYLLLAAMCAAFASAQLPSRAQDASNDVFKALITREFGTAVEEMTTIEKQIQAAKPEELRRMVWDG